MQDYEKLGLFYLGKTYDMKERQVTPNLVLYESKHLTTHAVCVGMTGSGKTGLGIALLEEAAIDGIPVIAIDPKGDLGNLLLTFPKLKRKIFSHGSIPTKQDDEGSLPSNSLPRRPSSGARDWLAGINPASGSSGYATRRPGNLHARKHRRAATDGAPLIRRSAGWSD